MRVIVSFVGGWGHAAPLLPLAAWAKELGHRVTFAGQAAFGERIVRLGYEFDVVGPDTLATTPQPLRPTDREAERSVMRDHFVAGFGHTRATLLGDLFDRERVELAICDDVDVGAVVAAEARGVPCVTVNVIAAGLLNHPSVVGPAWDQLRRTRGLAADPEARRIGGQLVIAPLPRSLRSPAAALPPAMRFVRPPIVEEHRSRPGAVPGRSLVYVTLGTVFNVESGDLLSRLVEAMNILSTTDEVDAVITTGTAIDPDDMPPAAPGVRIERFVPQRALLGRCATVVCHGGSGTVVDALSLGIPVVVLPMGADQLDNADRCAALGTGIALDPVDATPTEIAETTRAVLRTASFADAAAVISAEAHNQSDLVDVPELGHLLAPSVR